MLRVVVHRLDRLYEGIVRFLATTSAFLGLPQAMTIRHIHKRTYNHARTHMRRTNITHILYWMANNGGYRAIGTPHIQQMKVRVVRNQVVFVRR